MTASRAAVLTISRITGNINKAKRVLDEYVNTRGSTNLGSATVRKVIQGNSYITDVLKYGNTNDGLPCPKCKTMIPPESNCHVKYRHNNAIAIPAYYCEKCWDSLFY
jgi:hypothetical protein